MNYTKGPWRVNIWDYPNANPPRKDLVIENSTNRIAVLDWDQGLDNPYTIKNDEAQANARLISSVPDMYEACKSVIDLWEQWAKHSDCLSEPLRRSIEMRVEECQAAIRKAEGRNEE